MLTDTDKLKQRILDAKQHIPVFEIRKEFVERFPEYKSESEKKVKNMFLLRQVDEEMVEKLEIWSSEWIERIEQQKQTDGQ